MRTVFRSVSLLAFVCAALHASADPVAGVTSGVFVNPAPSGTTTTGTGTSHFTFGQGNPTPSSLDFAGGAFASSTGTPFKVGTLRYFNGTVTGGSTPTSVQLQVTLSLSTPPTTPQSFFYGLDLVNTPNTSDPDASADYVRLVSLPSQGSFMFGGVAYTLNLTSFQNVMGDGFLASSSTEFHVREGLSASADIYGTIERVTPAAPGPLAALPFALMAVRRRRRNA